MPKKNPPPPEELLRERPHLKDEPQVSHPSTDPRLGSPPSKYTPAVHEVICEELRKGQRPQGACSRAGITVAMFNHWVQKGRSGDPWLAQFAEDVEIAYNAAEAQAVDVIRSGVDTEDRDKMNSEDARWWLERARSDGFSKQVKTIVEGQSKQFFAKLKEGTESLPARMYTGPEIYFLVLSIYLGEDPGSMLSATSAPKQLTNGEAEDEDGSE